MFTLLVFISTNKNFVYNEIKSIFVMKSVKSTRFPLNIHFLKFCLLLQKKTFIIISSKRHRLTITQQFTFFFSLTPLDGLNEIIV